MEILVVWFHNTRTTYLVGSIKGSPYCIGIHEGNFVEQKGTVTHIHVYTLAYVLLCLNLYIYVGVCLHKSIC